MKQKVLGAIVATGLVLAGIGTGIFALPKRAQAHGCGSHPTPSTSKYYFRVYNTDSTLSYEYKVNGTTYSLSPGKYREHTTYSKYVTIGFDKFANTGNWEAVNVSLNADLHDIKFYYDGNNTFLKWYKVND